MILSTVRRFRAILPPSRTTLRASNLTLKLARLLGARSDSEDADLHVPALCDVEVVAVLRQLAQRGRIDTANAEQALEDYLASAIHRHDHEPWLWRLFELRDNFTPYDAAYVALAESLDATLVTLDTRLARAAHSHLRIATAP